MVLSICIPTYNFGAYIGKTLASIAPQLRDGVEIVILDGGSTDATSEVVADFQARFPRINYHRQAVRGGIDRDMARSIDLARGRYCWLFSADDIMDGDAIDRVLVELASDADVYLCRHRNATLDLRIVDEAHPVIAADGDRNFLIEGKVGRLEYFRLAQSSEAFFSFMSGLVVKRATWLSAPCDERFVGSCWSHAARLLSATLGKVSLVYLHAPLLTRRGDNDSFRQDGVVKRFALAIEGYHAIAASLFGPQSEEAVHIRRVIRCEFPLRAFLHAKTLCLADPGREASGHLGRLVRMTYRDPSLANLARYSAYRLISGRLYASVRTVVRRFQPHPIA